MTEGWSVMKVELLLHTIQMEWPRPCYILLFCDVEHSLGNSWDTILAHNMNIVH